jgi:hypothetical protein
MLLPYWGEWQSDRLAGGRRVKFRPGLENLEDRTVPSLFGPGPVVATSPQPEAVVVGDFNEDSHPDFAVAAAGPDAQTNGSLTVYINNGTGKAFQPPTSGPASYTVGRLPSALAAADFNKDGHLDLALTNANDHTVTVLLGNGDGSFRPAPGSPFDTGGTSPYSLGVADFNGDNKLDLAVGNLGSSEVRILHGNGTGGFTLDSIHLGGAQSNNLAVGDFTGDGRPEVAELAGKPNSIVQLFVQDSNGVFQAGDTLDLTLYPVGIAAGLINGDGTLDLVTANNVNDTVNVLINTGSGHFATAVSFPAGQVPYTMTLADLNGDGHLDVAVVGNHGVSVLLGNGNGGFITVPGSPFPGAAVSTGIAAGDFNGDGAPDLVQLDFTNGQALVLLNQFNTLQIPPNSSSPPPTLQDVTSLVHLGVATLASSPSATHLRRRLTLQNTSSEALTGTLWLVLDGLPRGVRVRWMTGRTTTEGRPGSPYLAVSLPGGVLNPGQRVRLVLDFINPRGRKIRYTPLILEGAGTL